ncbi:hypothetical protein ASPSYDRAFT_88856 [Aspergillus sydowii CBS 593.65]|uniref:Uncharacterized protein n=1 Tax=Aspergillus sydowii CBS 593.65 TaxID=1036612 RepID=A0A1L9TKM3_9EURO|nr:uncharacterized protein ASPSYDRAFT_88856 [Aspergillus sydowii CBS 593.65]OJJ59965.1 hypothetical protein ASPSYDRAFT_88856 [Aspergillus sydowii CBS 593.65]
MHVSHLAYVAIMVTGVIAAPGVASRDAKASLPRPIGGRWNTVNPIVGGIGGGIRPARVNGGPNIVGGQPSTVNEDDSDGFPENERRGDVGYNDHCNKDDDCVVGSFCIESKCSVGRDLANEGEQCTRHEDCAIGSFCVGNRCSVGRDFECTQDTDCVVGSFCVNNQCSVGRDFEHAAEDCIRDGDCGVGSFCVNRKCSVGRDFECTQNEDCVVGSFCIENKCSVGRDLEDNREPECNTHEDCPAGSFSTNYRCSVSRKAVRDLGDFLGECNSHEDCGVGSFCVSHWCTVARKLADGSMNLAARDVVAEDDDYWYLEARAAVDVLDELSGRNEKRKPKNKCPKKCGNGKHCCYEHFCQPPNCLGEF